MERVVNIGRQLHINHENVHKTVSYLKYQDIT